MQTATKGIAEKPVNGQAKPHKILKRSGSTNYEVSIHALGVRCRCRLEMQGGKIPLANFQVKFLRVHVLDAPCHTLGTC